MYCIDHEHGLQGLRWAIVATLHNICINPLLSSVFVCMSRLAHILYLSIPWKVTFTIYLTALAIHYQVCYQLAREVVAERQIEIKNTTSSEAKPTSRYIEHTVVDVDTSRRSE